MQNRIQTFIFALLFSIPHFAFAEGAETSQSAAEAALARLSQIQFVPKSTTYNTINPTPQIKAQIEKCRSAASLAETACIGNLSPHIQTAAGVLGGLLTMVNKAKMSTSESCEKYSGGLATAEKAIAAFNLACSAAQWNCDSSCTALMQITKTAALQKMLPPPDGISVALETNYYTADQAQLNSMQADFKNQEGICQGYKINIASAGVTLLGMLAQTGLQKTCGDATTTLDCKDEKNKADPKCATAAMKVDCSLEANVNTTGCICERNPNLKGCPQASGLSGPSAPNFNGTVTNNDNLPTPKPPTLTAGPEAPGIGAPSSGSSPGSSGLAAGGGGGGSGGGGGFGTGNSAKAGSADGKTKALNTNILSGYDGGGGGGGGSRGGSGRGDDSAYKAYLPGGAKDPSRGLASKTFGNGEVTAAGSKSNWEKVRERYQDNKPSLMGP
jgi:hypothetical protein